MPVDIRMHARTHIHPHRRTSVGTRMRTGAHVRSGSASVQKRKRPPSVGGLSRKAVDFYAALVITAGGVQSVIVRTRPNPRAAILS